MSLEEIDRALGIDKGKADPLWPLALRLAEACSTENGPELNALRMLEVLKACKAVARA